MTRKRAVRRGFTTARMVQKVNPVQVLVTRVPAEMHMRTKAAAAASGFSIEEVLRRLVWLYLDDPKVKRRIEELGH